MAQLMFGMSALSGILLTALDASTDRTRNEVLRQLNARYLDSSSY